MESTFKDKAQDLTEDIGDYLETYYQLKVLQITDKAANVVSVSLSSMVIAVLAIFMFLFLSIASAWWIGEALGNMVAGFAIVAGFYGLLSLLIVALQKKTIQPMIRNTIIKKTYG